MDDPIYQDFFDYCKYQKGLSENTIGSYFFDLTTYDYFLKKNGFNVRDVETRDIDSYIMYVGDILKNQRATVVRKVATLRAFYKYLYRLDEVKTDIMKKIEAPRMKKPLPRFLSLDQQKQLIEYFDKRIKNQAVSRWIHKRNKAIVIVFLDTGLRVSELCNMKLNDINFKQKVLHVLGKGGKEAEVFLPDRSINILKDYIKNDRHHLLRRGLVWSRSKDESGPFYVRRIVDGKSSSMGAYNTRDEAEAVLYSDLPQDRGFVFMRHSGKGMSTRHVFAILHRAGRSLGFRIHPHMLRHTFATNLRRKNADLQLIQEALRHSSIVTTAIYAHITSSQFKEEMGKYLNDKPEARIIELNDRRSSKIISNNKEVQYAKYQNE